MAKRSKVRHCCEYPFDGYYVFRLDERQNRMFITVYPEYKDRFVISYAKYLMSVHEKRRLGRYEYVHHIDGDQTNDVITNLQVLSPKEHGEIHKVYDDVELVCDYCKIKYIIPGHEYNKRMRKTSGIMVCSLSCATSLRNSKIGLKRKQQLKDHLNNITNKKSQ